MIVPKHRLILGALAGSVALAGLTAPAAAQDIPTVNPDGQLSDPAKPPPQPQQQPRQPTVIVQQPDGTPKVVGGQEGEGPQRYYYGDEPIDQTRANWDVKIHGPVPEHHVIRSGDTLWDISWLYFEDPWSWPEVWAYNPQITNPHWIYPGDMVRLYPQGESPVRVQQPDDPVEPVEPDPPAGTGVSYSVALRQLAFVDPEELDFAGAIVGAVDEKTLLSPGDQVYVGYPEGQAPEVGKRYAIYTPTQEVDHPDEDKGVVGTYVRILGELRIVSVKKDKRARAVIEESTDVIERGDKVGPIQRRYRGDQVEPVPNERNLQGTVVAILRNDQLIGEGELIFLDVGKNQKVKVGNVLHVVRRGDAYPGNRLSTVGMNEKGYPARSIGRVIVVDTGDDASAAIVMTGRQEFEVGDRVLMQKAK